MVIIFLATGLFYIPFESSVKCNPMVLFGFSYYDTGYLKKVKTEEKIGFLRPQLVIHITQQPGQK